MNLKQVVDCDPNRGTNRASQERKLKRLRPFAGRANPIKNEAKQLTVERIFIFFSKKKENI